METLLKGFLQSLTLSAKRTRMRKNIVVCSSFLFIFITQVFAQPKVGTNLPLNSQADQLTPHQQAIVAAIANKYRSGAVNAASIKKDIKGQSALSSLPVTDAVNLVMTRINQNAENDLQSAEAEVQSASTRKDSLRKKMDDLKKQQDILKGRLKNEYDTLRAVPNSNQQKKNYNQWVIMEKQSEKESADAEKRRKNAQVHLQSVQNALNQTQPRPLQQRK